MHVAQAQPVHLSVEYVRRILFSFRRREVHKLVAPQAVRLVKRLGQLLSALSSHALVLVHRWELRADRRVSWPEQSRGLRLVWQSWEYMVL